MSSVTSSTTAASTISSAAASTTAASQSALQAAAQSIISGSTGNTSMDVSSLVSALVNAKIAGQAAAITAAQTADNTQISAFGSLSSALSALQTGLSSLSNGTMLNTFKATASGNGLTATAGTGAVAGTYSIGVTQIASSQVLTSKGFQPATQQLGTGTMTLTVGGKSSTITLNGSNNTVSGIAAAINAASDNPGISASVVNGVDGAHLVLHSTQSGAANTISVSVNETDSGSTLKSLNVASNAGTTPGYTTNAAGTTTFNSGASTVSGSGWTQTTAAQDAYFTIDGTAVSSASNANTTALPGVTLNLTAAAVGATPQTLTIAPDTTAQATAISNFVSLYNTLVSTFGTLTAYTQGAGSQGPLLGDSTLNLVQNTLASTLANGVKSGTQNLSLASIGITLNADGTLALDNTALNTALTSKPGTVAALFNSSNGVAATMNAAITGYLSPSGPIQTRTSALSNDLTNLASKQTALATYQTQLTNQYQAQFTALNTLMSEMNNNAQYLTQLFGGTNSQGALSANK